MKVRDLATLSTGLVTTRKKVALPFQVAATYPLLTLHAVGAYGTLDWDKLATFESVESLSDRYFTQAGDVLLRLNHPFTSLYIDPTRAGILIPSYFVKLRTKTQRVKAEYLACYLNSRQVKQDFLRSQSGTLVASINQRILKDVDIPVKTLADQEEIINLHQLFLRERELLKSLLEEKEKYFQGLSQELMKP